MKAIVYKPNKKEEKIGTPEEVRVKFCQRSCALSILLQKNSPQAQPGSSEGEVQGEEAGLFFSLEIPGLLGSYLLKKGKKETNPSFRGWP